MSTQLPIGAKIGILGGGQLGRMLALAAAELGFTTALYCPQQCCPAAEVTGVYFAADYDDQNALAHFADTVDVVTYEFENVPADTVAFLLKHVPVRPGLKALTTAQDRLVEKSFLRETGCPVADFWPVNNACDLDLGLGKLAGRGVLKTCRLGYDGKGQVVLRTPADRAAADDLLDRGLPLVLEALIPFDCEISVIAARAQDGTFCAYDIGDNRHENHILKTSKLPSSLPDAVRRQALNQTAEILTALDYVGVMAVEFFVVHADQNAELFVNEIAPRVHNSGHWTQDAAITSQFEQHIRAICGWPLGDPSRFLAVTMENLIGDDISRVPALATEPSAKLHLYGKSEVRAGRKMGHVNWLGAGSKSCGGMP